MLLEQLSSAQEYLTKHTTYNLNDINNIITFLSDFKGTYIYPRIFKRKFNIDMVKAYEILNNLVRLNILKLSFEVYCNKCDKFQNDIYDSLNEIPKNLTCEYCDKDIDFSKDIIVIYRVCSDE